MQTTVAPLLAAKDSLLGLGSTVGDLTSNLTSLAASTGVCLSNLTSLTSAVKPLTDIASSLVQLPGNLSSLEVRPGAGAGGWGRGQG